MQITRIRALRGPNLWTRSTAIEAIVQCEDGEQLYTAIAGFEDRLRARFPTIGTLQLFDEPMNITQGLISDVTLTLSLYIYKLSFRFVPNFGYAATVSYVIVVLVAILAFIQFYAARENDR